MTSNGRWNKRRRVARQNIHTMVLLLIITFLAALIAVRLVAQHFWPGL
jgi:hypothetical protein